MNKGLTKIQIAILVVVVIASGVVGYIAGYFTRPASVEFVNIGLVAPLSGPWAYQGKFKKLGCEMAVDDINEQGGIKSLGGAKLVLRIADAGSSAEEAAAAAERLIGTYPIVAGIGAWHSAFTLAITEVTERAHIPWLTLSLADAITQRGFRYVFRTSAKSSWNAQFGIEFVLNMSQAVGYTIQRIAIVSDSNAASVAFTQSCKNISISKGLEVVMDQVWTSPLSDATPIVTQIKNLDPDFLVFGASTFVDAKLVIDKMQELNYRVPMMSQGSWPMMPPVLEAEGPEPLEGWMTVAATWPRPGCENIVQRYMNRTGEPWMNQDALIDYGHVWIIKEALERCGSTDPTAVRDAIAQLNLSGNTPPAVCFTGGYVRFDETGQRPGWPVLVQWQNGTPVSVWPPEDALAEPEFVT